MDCSERPRDRIVNAERLRRGLWARVPIRLLAVVLLLATGLATPAAAATRGEARVVVRLWNQMAHEPARGTIDTLIRQFNATHPDIHVDLLHIGQMEQKLLTSTIGRVPPDLAIFDRFRVSSYAYRRTLTDLSSLVVEHGIHAEDFFEAPWSECVYEGGLYGVPLQTDVRVLYYNREMFRQAGLDPDRPPRTWAEARAMSEQLTRRDERGRLTQIGFAPSHGIGNTWLYLFGWQNGATFLSEDGQRALLDDPKLVGALEWIRDFTQLYGHSDLQNFVSGFGRTEMHPLFTNQMAMVGDEVYLLSVIKRYAPNLDFGVAPMPWPENGQRATWSGGYALIVPEGSPNVVEAMEIIAYLVSTEAQIGLAVNGAMLPANRHAVEIDHFRDDPKWRVFIEEMEYSHFRPVTPVGSLMWDELSRAYERGGSGLVEPARALQLAQTNVQAEIDRLNAEASLPVLSWTWILGTVLVLLGGGVGWRAWHSGRKVRRMTLFRHEAMQGYLMALPVMVGLAVFWIGPIIVTIAYSFSSYDVLREARWVGLDNYRTLAADPLFWRSFWNTLHYVLLSVPTAVGLSLLLALLLNQSLRGRAVWRTVFFLPSVVPLVALALLFLWLYNGQYGLFNVVLHAVGLPSVPWMTSPRVSRISLALMNLWTVGPGMIIFLAALQGVPRHLHEAAIVDGAGRWQRFVVVTFPHILPVILFMVIINTIGGFQIFTQAFLMTSGIGGPQDSTLFYVFYLFRQGFEYFNMGIASAMAWILFLVILVVTFVQFKLTRIFQGTDGS